MLCIYVSSWIFVLLPGFDIYIVIIIRAEASIMGFASILSRIIESLVVDLEMLYNE